MLTHWCRYSVCLWQHTWAVCCFVAPLEKHWAGLPKVVRSIPAVVRFKYQPKLTRLGDWTLVNSSDH